VAHATSPCSVRSPPSLFSVCHVLLDHDHLPRQARDDHPGNVNARAVSAGHKIDLLEVKERAKDTATQAAAGDCCIHFSF
jgi:hypothetical protein